MSIATSASDDNKEAVPTCHARFNVSLPGRVEDRLYLSGSCSALGNEDVSRALQLFYDENASVWKTPGYVYVPLHARINYRYVHVDGKGREIEEGKQYIKSVVFTDLEAVVYDNFFEFKPTNVDWNESHLAANTRDHVCLVARKILRPRLLNHQLESFEPNDMCKVALGQAPDMTTLLIVSFELPLKVIRNAQTSTFTFEKQKSLVMPQLHTLKDQLQYDVKFIGWPGIIPADVTEQKEIEQLLRPHCCIPVFVQPEILEGFIEFVGCCLWPFFHNVFVPTSYDLLHLNILYWNTFLKLNETFANSVKLSHRTTDLVWIHDFHLILVPKLLRQYDATINIGFFLHTPFPTAEIFSLFPEQNEMLSGMLACNLIGFHFFEYARHFLSACKKLLNLNNHFRMGGSIEIDYHNRNVMLYIGHVHLQYDELCRIMCDDDLTEIKSKCFGDKFNSKFIFASVDRCDRLSGIELKLRGFHDLLRDYADARGRAILIQLAYHSGISKDHQEIEYEKKVLAIAEQINLKFGSSSSVAGGGPVILSIKKVIGAEKYALYRMASCFLDTSIGNGLNLNPFEFICCNKNNPAPLILSEFTGCCNTLASAYRVNPWKIEAITEALDRAINNKSEETNDRFSRDQMYIQRNSTIGWANEFLSELRQSRQPVNLLYVSPGLNSQNRLMQINSNFRYLDKSKVLKKFLLSHRRVFCLDHEGTLASDFKPFKTVEGLELLSAHGNAPNKKIYDCLRILCSAPENIVVILSGRDSAHLDKWFKDIDNIILCAEHGFFHKIPSSTNLGWECLFPLSRSDLQWKSSAFKMMRQYVKRTQGAFIENKGSALVFQYRDADTDIGAWHAKELTNLLEISLLGFPVNVVSGKGYVEVKHRNVSKGKAVKHLLCELDKKMCIDFILCIGDDRSDEEMFSSVESFEPSDKSKSDSTFDFQHSEIERSKKPAVFTVTVGKKPSLAHNFLHNVDGVLDLLMSCVDAQLKSKMYRNENQLRER